MSVRSGFEHPIKLIQKILKTAPPHDSQLTCTLPDFAYHRALQEPDINCTLLHTPKSCPATTMRRWIQKTSRVHDVLTDTGSEFHNFRRNARPTSQNSLLLH
jgi:hypothetical protein